MKLYRFLPALGLVLHTSVAMAATLDVPQIAWRDLQQGDLIGQGSFGDVYDGTWGVQQVAIKVLHMKILPPGQIRKDFDQEVGMMWQCQFPRILRLYGVCTEPGHCAMIFERMHGSLYDLIHSGDAIPEDTRWHIASDVAQGLARLHNRGIIHRDLKSHNILLDRNGRAKICDFGLAKLRATTSSTMTARRPAGTLRWCAPELLDTEPNLTLAADMYSYGMVLWELTARKTPFASQPNDTIIMASVLGGKRESIPPDCHPVWKDIIEDCWKGTPTQRPTIQAVLDRLKGAQPPSIRPIWLPEEEPDPSTIGDKGFAKYPASMKDWQKVLQSYTHHSVPGYDVGKVDVIFNPTMNESFVTRRQLLQQRQGNPRYTANWKQEPDAALRSPIDQQLEKLAEAYQDDDYSDVKMMPLWHGTQTDKLGSILSAGYSPFGDTDDGYFGKGIYATPEAVYADMYANKCEFDKQTHQLVRLPNGVLIMNWGVLYNSYPIIRKDYDTKNEKLVRRIAPGRYDAHFVPVVQGSNPSDYVPITPPETSTYTEVMFLDSAQVLPRYIITLQPSLVGAPNSQVQVMCRELREKLEALEADKRRCIRTAYHEEQELKRQQETNTRGIGANIRGIGANTRVRGTNIRGRGANTRGRGANTGENTKTKFRSEGEIQKEIRKQNEECEKREREEQRRRDAQDHAWMTHTRGMDPRMVRAQIEGWDRTTAQRTDWSWTPPHMRPQHGGCPTQ